MERRTVAILKFVEKIEPSEYLKILFSPLVMKLLFLFVFVTDGSIPKTWKLYGQLYISNRNLDIQWRLFTLRKRQRKSLPCRWFLYVINVIKLSLVLDEQDLLLTKTTYCLHI